MKSKEEIIKKINKFRALQVMIRPETLTDNIARETAGVVVSVLDWVLK